MLYDDSNIVFSVVDGRKVGINTAAPSRELDVKGAVAIENNASTTALYLKQTYYETIASVQDSNLKGLTILQGGRVGLNESNPVHILDIEGDVEIVNSNARTALYVKQTKAQTAVQLYDSNELGITMLQGGRIGINTSAPVNSLDVIGNVDIKGNLTIASNLTVNGTVTTLNTETYQTEKVNSQLYKGPCTACQSVQ